MHIPRILLLLWFGMTVTSGKAFAPAALPDSTVTLDFVCMDGQPGDTVCVDIDVTNFVNISSVQLSFTFDPFVLKFVSIENEALSLGQSTQPGPSDIRYIWTEPSAGTVDLPDGSTLMQLCFEIIGAPGSESEITLDPGNPGFDNEIGDGDGLALPIVIEPCTVEVQPAVTVGAFLSACGAPGGAGDGMFTISAYGGTGPYTYSWVHTTNGAINGSSMLANAGDEESQSVPPGIYEVTIMDALGETRLYTIEVAVTSFIHSATPVNHPTCANYTNGRISVDATEGTAPYSVLWEHATDPLYSGSTFIQTAGGSYIINSLPVGDYYLTIMDANGCTVMDTVNLFADPYQFSVTTFNAMCLGAMDGRVEIVIGGSHPDGDGFYDVSVSWSGSVFTTNELNTINIFDPGEYWVSAVDEMGCRDTFYFTIGSDIEFTANITTTPTTCATAGDGQVIINAFTNGTAVGPYTYTLYDAGGMQFGMAHTDITGAVEVQNLAAGNYGVVIEEGNCRSDTIPFVIPAPEPLAIMVEEVQPNGCVVGAMNGRITVSASGGTVAGDYTYLWNGGTLSGSTIANLPSGNYVLTVTDDNMCSAQLTVNVQQGVGPQIIDIIATGFDCSGGSGMLELIYTDGTAPVESIEWSTGGNTPIITIPDPPPASGMVNVTIRDSLFCFDFASFTLPSSGAIVIDSVVIDDPTCGGDMDGMITVYASQGVEPYTYIWSTGDTTSFNLLAGLSDGTYSVTVMDSDTCADVDTTVELASPEKPVFTFSARDSTSCSDACDGRVTLTPTGGDPNLPWYFTWESGLVDTALQSSPDNLCAGYQTVTVSQDNLCFFTDSVFISAPNPVVLDTAMVTDVSCFGLDDGEITASGGGGSGGYSYNWSTLESGPTISQLSEGLYLVTITDAQMCTAVDSARVTEPDSLAAQIDSAGLVQPTCSGLNSGAITIAAQGGTPGYMYAWVPNVSTNAMASGLSAGAYLITVTDDNGCTDTASVVLSGPEPVLSFVPDIVPPVCFGGTTLVSVDSAIGGDGMYTFSLNGGQSHPLDTAIEITAGIYNLVVEDGGNCADTTLLVIVAPNPIELSIEPANPVLTLGDSLQLQLLSKGNQGPLDSIGWSQNGPLSCYSCPNPIASNILPTTYVVKVVDSAGCRASLDVFVDVDQQRIVYIPNAFSPNFDGRNDEFKIFTGPGVVGVPSARVFDRWGELMSEHKGMLPSEDGIDVWDGTFQNSPMPPGVYIYYIEVAFADNEVLRYRGDVTLLR